MDEITLLLAVEARDRASALLSKITGGVKSFEQTIAAAAATSMRSAEEIDAANMRATAATASYDRAIAARGAAEAELRTAMAATTAAQLEADAALRAGAVTAEAASAAVVEAATAEEAALMRLQESERLVAVRSAEMGAAQEAASAKTGLGAAAAKTAAVAAGATAIAVGVVGAASVHAAGDFEASTTRLVTSAGEVRENLDTVRAGALKMAGEVGYSTEQLTASLYKIESGGQHGAAGLAVLRASAEGAKAENAKLETVADAVTSVLVDYHLKASDAATVTSKLVAATSQGKTTFEELSASLAAVLPVASAAKVPLDDILGDLASMTVHGMSAQQASQNLADTIRHMQNPTAVQAKELALLGLTTNQLAEDLKTKGLSGTLNEISERVAHMMPPGAEKVVLDLRTALNGLPPEVQKLGREMLSGEMSMAAFTKAAKGLDPISAKQATSFATLAGSMHRIGDVQTTGAGVMQSYGAALAKATGDATGLNTILMVSGENSGVTAGAIKAISAATTEAGNHVKGWGEIQQTFNYKLDSLKGHLESAKIALGLGLLPAVDKIVRAVSAAIVPIATWMSDHQQLSAIILGSLGGIATLTLVVLGAVKAFQAVRTAIMAVRLAMVAMKLATMEADAAFALSPLGIIVIAVIALAAAVWYCWTHFEGFRKAVIAAWDGIKTASLYVWNNVLKPLFETWWASAKTMAGIYLWLWHNAIEPAIQGIAAVAMWLWNSVLKPAFTAWWGFAQTMASIYMWLWHNAIEPAMQAIGAVVMWLWRSIIEPGFHAMAAVIGAVASIMKAAFVGIKAWLSVLGAVFYWLYRDIVVPVWQEIQAVIGIAWAVIQVIFGMIQIQIRILADTFTWLWHNIAEPIWHGIAAVISWTWDNLIKPYIGYMVGMWQFLGSIFVWLYENVIGPVWRGIFSVISGIWTNGIKPIFTGFANIITDYVVPGFKAGVDALGKAWGFVADVAKVPIRFTVNTILNDGLLAAYNWVAKTFGVKPDNVHVSLPAGFAKGGYTGAGGKYDPAGIVHRGEYVIPKEVVDARGIEFFDALVGGSPRALKYPGDRRTGLPGYADGGFVDDLWDAITHPVETIRKAASVVINRIPGAAAVRDLAVGAAHKGVEGLISWVKGSSATSSAGSAMAFLRAQEGKPYGWAMAGPDAYDCSGIVSSVWNVIHGRSPYSHTFSTANEASFFPNSGVGMLMAGWTNPGERGPGGGDVGHTAGQLAGVPFESTGDRGVHVGSGVTPLSAFAHVGTFDRGGPLHPGWTAAYNGTGHDEWVSTGGPQPQVVIDLRGSQFISDREIDRLIERLDKRLARTMLPAAGVQVRR